MKLDAKRVSAAGPGPTDPWASAAAAGARSRSITCSASSRPRAASGSIWVVVARSVVVIALSRDPDADPTEPRRHRRMSRVPDLLRLALAAVRRPPELPLVATAEHVHGSPEPRADAGVGRVAQHSAALALLDLPADLAPELEVEPLVVDRPGAVRIHQDPVVRRGDHLVQRVRAREKP